MMSPDRILSRLRSFLLALSGLLCAGTIAELWLAEHMETVVQLIPFGLCGLGLVAALVVLLKPRRIPILTLRIIMALVAVGGLYGIYEHIENNIEFQREINPSASTGDAVIASFYGPNPLLAPGIVAVAAALAVAATYHHPALLRESKS
ncbi:MAG TPA: hypothetical protein VJQ56_10830 [Blastocatellia bacterium]|nr:hypothetical protein [Blastocatellia bacterium]